MPLLADTRLAGFKWQSSYDQFAFHYQTKIVKMADN